MSLEKILFPKPLSTGEYQVMLRFIHNRKPSYKALFKISYEDWDVEKKEVKKSNPLYAYLNDLLQTKYNFSKSRYLEALKYDGKISSDYILGKVSKKEEEEEKRKPPTVMDAFTMYLNIKKGNVGVDTLECYSSRARCVNSVLGSYRINELTKKHLERYTAHLKRIKNGENTIFAKVKFLNEMLRYFQDDYRLFLTVNVRLKQVKPQKTKLTIEEIEKIKEYSVLTHGRRRDSINIFLAQFYCFGTRISDMLMLKRENLDGDRVRFQHRKTKVWVSNKVPVDFFRIANKYLNESNGVYVFPFMEEFMRVAGEEPNQKLLKNKIDSCNSLIRTNLQEVAKMLDIDKKISTHIARHSFASMADKIIADKRHISKALGHSSFRTTEIYLGSLRDDEIDDSMALVYKKGEKHG